MNQLKDSRGANVDSRGTDRGEALVQLAHAKYADAVIAGRVFSGGTDESGVAPGTALGTAAAFVIENPADSGVNAVLLSMSMGYISGTLGAGTVFYTVDVGGAAATPIVTSTAITEYNALIGDRRRSQCKLHDAATILATPTILRPFAQLQASLASTAVAPVQIIDHLDGEFVLKPGSILAMEAVAAAGTSPLVGFGCTWEEIPV